MKTFSLTSPYMQHPDVRLIQRALGVPTDGVFGPVTASAVARWKRYAGYPSEEINNGIGPQGQRWLLGVERLPAEYRKRGAERRAAAPVRSVPAKALDIMRNWAGLGVKENPAGSNEVPMLVQEARALGVRLYPDMGIPWCEWSVNLAALLVGGKAAREGLVDRKWNAAYTVDAVAQARAGQHFQKLVSRSQAKPGDKVYFNFGSKDFVQHVGRLIRFEGNNIVTVDGNTSAHGSQDNGGAVLERTRSLSTVRAFVRDM